MRINPFFELKDGNRYEIKRTRWLIAEYRRLNEESPLSDTDRANAINKLDAVYNVTKNNIHEYIEAYSVALIDTDKNLDYSVDNGYVTSIMLGALICATICIIIVLAVNALDNTVKDKDEFESLTGVNVISFIDKEKTSK